MANDIGHKAAFPLSRGRPIEPNRADDRIHRIFVVSIILKGFHALLECASGIALYLLSAQTITRWVELLTQHELSQDPRDFVAIHLLDAAHHLSVSTQSFYAYYLLSHGLVKIVIVVGLLRERLWAYPVSLVVMAGFIAYQLYRYSHTHGVGLIILTVVDVFVVVLVWHEWRMLRRQLQKRGS